VAVSDFDTYAALHGRSYEHGSVEYHERRALFERRRAEVDAQNARPERLWTATLNTFADRTDGELAAFRGYKPSGPRSDGAPSGTAGIGSPSGLLELEEERPAPSNVTWQHLRSAIKIRDQGSCGSCWAETTVAVLEAHHEIYMKGQPLMFAPQELVSCVTNPRHCGGKGGCDGATVELGMQWVMKNGLKQESEMRYQARDIPCGRSLVDRDAKDDAGRGGGDHGGASIGLQSYKTLPSNKEQPLVRALIDKGPVAVSVAATGWFSYSQGIFDSCASANYVVDHAVTLYGYGHEGKNQYWTIRNSWGKEWGEHGYVRLMRTKNEEHHCGIDHDPAKGVGCDGGPSQVRVCGSCGILYDSVVPYFGRGAAAAKQANVRRHRRGEGKAQSLVAVEEDGATAMAIDSDAVPRLVRRELP
jgi:cathepsin L